MPLPDDFYEEDRNYRIRLCMLVSESTVVIPGSKIHVCDSCDAPIWVDEEQPIPDMPNGLELHGDVNVCRNCMLIIHAKAKDDEVTWIGPPPSASIEEVVKRILGMTGP